MTATNKVPNLSFWSQLIALVAIYGVLGTQLASAVHPKEPFMEVKAPVSTQFKNAAIAHVIVHNAAYYRHAPSKIQLSESATLMESYARTILADGTLGQAEAYFWSHQSQFYSFQPNGTQAYQSLGPYGNQTPISEWTFQENRSTQYQKQQFVALMQQQHFYNVLLLWSQIMYSFSEGGGIKGPGNPLGMVHTEILGDITNAQARGILDCLSLVGGILMWTGDPIGIVMVAGAGAGLAYMDFEGL
jgi:hypothetical protein